MEKIFALNEDNFFGDIKAECPLTYSMFQIWIDAYKLHIKWTTLFGEATSVSEKGIRFAPKFHEVPFDMQRGIMQTFFRTQYFSIATVPHTTSVGFAYEIVDFERKEAYYNFVDDTFTIQAFYPMEPICLVDAFKRAFRALEEKLESNKKFEE